MRQIQITAAGKNLPQTRVVSLRTWQPSRDSMRCLIEKVCKSIQLPLDVVAVYVENYKNQIRWQDPEIARRAVLAELAQVPKMYGARYQIPENVLLECCRLVLKKFRNLSPLEIREAYQMWASEEIKVTGGAMYGGEFNAMQLGKVLSAYRKHRKPVAAKVWNKFLELSDETEKEYRRQKAKERFEIDFPKSIERARNKYRASLGKGEDPGGWEQVPVFWYLSAFNRKYFQISLEEKRKYYSKAIAIVAKDQRKGQECLGAIIPQFIDPLTQNPAAMIAKKMIVFDKIISNPDWNFPET
jgi:hypothetical protein